MKISIITITYGDGALLRRNIDSVHSQSLPADVEVEHIIVDSNSSETDEVAYGRCCGSTIIKSPPRGVYNAINVGIHHASGDVIGLLNGSDSYATPDIIATVAEAIKDVDFIFGDIQYTSSGRLGRVYSAAGYKTEYLKRGYAPPHPSLFIRHDVAKTVGDYREDFVIAGDYDYFVRLFLGNKQLRYKYLPRTVVYMESGGVSGTFKNRLITNTVEIRRALKINGYNISWLRLFLRYFYHIKH